MIRVAHVITGLGTGGAEIMLWRLLSALDKQEFDNLVISLAPEGPIADRIRALGVPVQSMNLRSDASSLLGVLPLRKLLSTWSPDVVHTWMYHADLLGSAAAKLLGLPVVWALHNATLDPKYTPRRHRALVRTLARLSARVPERIISCSNAARLVHERMGYAPERLTVIPNGFDTQQFRPDPSLRSAARKAWGMQNEDIVIGNIGRFHPHKDHETFVRAAGLSHRSNPQLRFVMYGDRVTGDNPDLRRWMDEERLGNDCLTLGGHSEIWKVIPGLDLLVSSSRTEAFPLAVGEAMACAVPCVVTDVGDSAWVVGDDEAVVPAGAPSELAKAIQRMARMSTTTRREQGERARRRVTDNFSLLTAAARYSDVYRETTKKRRRSV